MSFVRRPITSLEAWLELRPNYVGMSEVAALRGAHPFMTAAQLQIKKRDRIVDVETPAMRRGRRLQSVAFEILRDEFPTWNIEDPKAYWIDESLKAICTPDALVIAPEHGLGVAEIKSVEPQIYKKLWFDEFGEPRVPDYVQIQTIGQMDAVGANWGIAVPFVVGHGIEIRALPVAKHAPTSQWIRDEIALMWHRIERDELPPFDYGRDRDVILSLFRAANADEAIDLTGDNMLPEILDRRERAAELARTAEAERKACDAMIIDRMRTAAIATFNGGTVTAKTVNVQEEKKPRAGYSFRRVIIKRNAA